MMMVPLLIFVLFECVRGASAATQLKQRVVVFHGDAEPPIDAVATYGFVSVAERSAPFLRSKNPRVVEEIDRATVRAQARGALALVEPTTAPTREPTPEPTLPRFKPRELSDRSEKRSRVVRATHAPTSVGVGVGVGVGVRASSEWSGHDVDVYVVDSGCVGGESEKSFLFEPDAARGTTTSNHGSYVASILREAAPGARMKCVRVLDESATGTVSALASALGWISTDCSGSCVVNLSLGSVTRSSVLEKSAAWLVDRFNIVVVAASGSGSATSMMLAPASSTRVLSVGGAGAARSNLTGTAKESSVSAAWVSGAAAQLREKEPTMNAWEIQQRLVEINGRFPTTQDDFEVPTTFDSRIAHAEWRTAWSFASSFCLEFETRERARWIMVDQGLELEIAHGVARFQTADAEQSKTFRDPGFSAVYPKRRIVVLEDGNVRVTAGNLLIGTFQIQGPVQSRTTLAGGDTYTNVVRCLAHRREEETLINFDDVPPCERATTKSECAILAQAAREAGLKTQICAWFGACHPPTFCGFSHPNACAANAGTCAWDFERRACHARGAAASSSERRSLADRAAIGLPPPPPPPINARRKRESGTRP